MIAIVYPQFYGVGGIARYLDSFLTNLPSNHPTVYLITGDEHRVERHFPGVEIIHIPFTSNRFNLFFWSLKARKILVQLHTQKKIKYVNLHIPPLIPGFFIPNRIPLILTAHTTYIGMSGRIYPEQFFVSQWGRFEIAFKLWMEKQIFKQATKIITLTEQGRQELLSYGINKPIEIIPNGVDTKSFTFTQSVVKEFDVLFCGRIEQRKGSRAMVEVCQALIQHKNDVRILIVGYGDDDAWVKSQLGEYAANVLFTGKVNFSEMQHYYAKSKLYVSTSYYEGLPGTCLEAMAMRLPAVVWDFLFYRGLLEEGKTGYFVEPNNTLLMTEKILKILSDSHLYSALQSNTRPHIENHYDWKILSNKVLAVFEQ